MKWMILRNDDQNGSGGGGGDAGAGAGAGAAGAQGGQGGAGSGQGGDNGGQAGQHGQQGQFSVPKEYAEKGWAKKVKTQEDLYKLVDGQDALIGKKHIVPDLSKTDDPEVKQYLETLRGTTKVTDYKFAEGTPKEFSEKVGTMLFNKGIPAAIGNQIIADYQKMVQADHAAMFSKEGMQAELKKTFGDDNQKAGQVINMVSDILGAEGKEFMETKIPNHFVGFMFKFMDAVKTKYGINDSGTGGEGGEGGGGKGGDVNAIRADLRAQIRALDARQHTAEEKATLQAKLDATYKS